jgi:predicted MFS family arabinose efflux permease
MKGHTLGRFGPDEGRLTLAPVPMSGSMSYLWIIFSISTANFFLSQLYRAANAVIAPLLIHDLSLDTGQLGLLSGSFFYGFALMQIPITLLLDRVGPRRMITGLSLIGILGAFIFSFAGDFRTGVLGRVLLGVGMSCNLIGTLKLLTSWFAPGRFATLAGVVFSMGTLGNMAATSPLVLLVNLVGWRPGFRLIAVLNLVLVAAFYLLVKDAPQKNPSISPPGEGDGRMQKTRFNLWLLLKRPDFWIISMGALMSYGVFAAFQTLWAGPFLIEVMGFTPMVCGNLILFVNAGFLIGPMLCGTLSDRIFLTRKWVVVWGHVGFAAVAAALAVLQPGTPLWILALLLLCFGLFRGTGSLMYTHIKELMPIEMAGAAMGGVNFFVMVGAAVFLHGLGLFMQCFYPYASRGPDAFSGAFILSAACVASVSVIYLFTRDTGPQG